MKRRFSGDEEKLNSQDVIFNKTLSTDSALMEQDQYKKPVIEEVAPLTTEEVQSLAGMANTYKLALGKNRYGASSAEKTKALFNYSKQVIIYESEVDALKHQPSE